MTMYLEYFGLREAPFRITPHTEFFFAGANRGATLEGLLYAITAGEGLVKVTGEVGSGKTMLCRVLLERLPKTVETVYLAVPSVTRDEMLTCIASDLGIDTAGATTPKLVRALQERLIELHRDGRQVVALIDEAHAIPLATLEEIRLLSNLETGTQKLLQIVLFGQPELDEHLAAPNMRQLKERITHSFALEPLPPRDVKEYVDFRLRAAGYHGPDLFGPEALRVITEAAEGLTRRINIYADKTLLAAFAAGTHTITADHARAAVADTQIVVTRRETPRRLAYAAAAGLVAGIVLGFIAARATSEPAGAPRNAQASASVPASAPKPAQPSPIPVAMAAPVTIATPVASIPADPLSARLSSGREILEQPIAGRFAVQLMVADARERAYVGTYLADAAKTLPAERIFVAAAGNADTPRLGVVYGPFAGRAEASAALAALPDGFRQFGPYVRPLEAIRDESRRAERR
jgi:type II secretory pathway predicted ATPase ExeA/septal ring-binding cell division protein DamX